MKSIAIVLFYLGFIGGQLTNLRLFTDVRFSLLDIGVLAIWILGVLYRKKRIQLAEIGGSILCFATVGFIALLLRFGNLSLQSLGISFLYLLRWILYAGLVLFSKRLGISWMSWLYTGGTSLAFLGLAQLIFYPDLRNLYYLGWDPHFGRLFSTLLDPNFTGLILVLTLILGYVKKYPWFWQPVNLTALFFTYSRSSFLALVFGLGSLMLVKRKNYLLMLIPILFLVFWARSSSTTLNFFRLETSVARLTNWQDSWELIRKSPIIGYGFNTIRYLPKFQPRITEIPSLAQSGVDNSFLFILLTTGAVGLCTYLWLLVNIWKLNSVVVNSSLIAIIVHSLFNNSLFYPWVMVWLWILVGSVTSDK